MTFSDKCSKGFSLIEVLVTLVIVSVSVMGFMSLQTRSLTYTQDAINRSQASFLADQMLEIMRADSSRVLDDIGVPLNNSPYYKEANTDFPNKGGACDVGDADPDSQLDCWRDKIQRQLPVDGPLLRAQFYICRSTVPGVCSSGKGSAIEIQMAWRVNPGECLAQGLPANANYCVLRVRSEL